MPTVPRIFTGNVVYLLCDEKQIPTADAHLHNPYRNVHDPFAPRPEYFGSYF
jgi:hypothetical protein